MKVSAPTENKCIICRKDFTKSSLYPDNNLCIICQDWYDKWEKKDDPRVARINGSYFTIQELSDRGRKILFDDGRIAYVESVFHLGRIPICWQVIGLDDNAEWM